MNPVDAEFLKILVTVVGGITSVTVLVVGWLINRSIGAVDKSINSLDEKVDGIKSELHELDIRVTRIEERHAALAQESRLHG